MKSSLGKASMYCSGHLHRLWSGKAELQQDRSRHRQHLNIKFLLPSKMLDAVGLNSALSLARLERPRVYKGARL